MKPTASVPRKPQQTISPLSNRFSVLEVEECINADFEEEVIPSLPRRILGGGSVNNTKKKQDEKRVSLDNSTDNNTPTSQITVEILKSATTDDESVCVDTPNSSTGDEFAQVGIPSVKNKLQKLETSPKDTNSEHYVTEDPFNDSDIDNSVRDNGVKDKQMNKSDLQVKHLLNGPDKMCKNDDQTTEKSDIVLKSKKLFEGQIFSTYEEFRNMKFGVVKITTI